MSLSKQRIQDKIEIVGDFKHIQIRYSDQIIEDGKVISSSYYRDRELAEIIAKLNG